MPLAVPQMNEKQPNRREIKMQKGCVKFDYKTLGHKSLRKLVCMKPGSRQPTVLAGGPDIEP